MSVGASFPTVPQKKKFPKSAISQDLLIILCVFKGTYKSDLLVFKAVILVRWLIGKELISGLGDVSQAHNIQTKSPWDFMESKIPHFLTTPMRQRNHNWIH